jgi:hypothetical protein
MISARDSRFLAFVVALLAAFLARRDTAANYEKLKDASLAAQNKKAASRGGPLSVRGAS